MEPNQPSKYESFISVESRTSNISRKSLDRHSWQMAELNNDKKLSLVEAMSIESENKNRRSDIFERLLESDKKSTKNRPSSIINSQNEGYIQTQYHNQRNSDVVASNQIEIDHECGCFEECKGQQCVCFKSKNQMCIKGSCCSTCVQIKNHLLRSHTQHVTYSGFTPYSNQNSSGLHNQVRQNLNFNGSIQQVLACNCKNTECLKSYCKCFQKGEYCSGNCGCESCKNKFQSEERNLALQVIKSSNEVTFCTCKKTKCNKKYCSCYASGVKCGKHCSCENCINCDKNSMMDIEVYEGEEEQDYKNAEMPERMSFQPVVFE